MVTVKYDDLSAAFGFVSFAAPFEHRAFVSLDTGAVYWVSDANPIDEENLPDDLETSDRYIPIPHKNELDLGNNLAFRFAEEHLPHRYANVEACFRHRGCLLAFQRTARDRRVLGEMVRIRGRVHRASAAGLVQRE